MTEKNVPEFQYELDAKGLMCPEPVMLLHKKVREMLSGDVLKVEATDPSTTRDIPQFCKMLDHTLIQEDVEDSVYIYYIQRR
jgi:tRNA 2-thiouridine synthesizing protein A